MKKSLKFLGGFSMLLFILFLGLFVWADTNGIWHNAQDIRGGIFGDDEQESNMNYTFRNPVNFQDEIQVNTIKSNNANGNVEIQLG